MAPEIAKAVKPPLDSGGGDRLTAAVEMAIDGDTEALAELEL